MMLWYGAHWMFWQVLLAWIGMFAFWGLVIWAVLALVGTRRRPSDWQQPDSARRVLDERLARGEIDEDEYRRLRDLLASGEHRPHAGTGSRREP